MHDLEIRRQLRYYLERAFGNDPTALVLDEFGICCGKVRADMAVVNGELKGFEIKSDQDTLLRLKSQAFLYGKVFDTVSIIVAAKHLDKIHKIVPRWWGVVIADENGRSPPRFTIYRREGGNPNPDPLSIAQLIWRDEALEVLKISGLASGLSSKLRKFLWEALVQNFSLADLRTLVRRQLKARGNRRSVVSCTQYDEKSRVASTS
jgi:hypothetical protein